MSVQRWNDEMLDRLVNAVDSIAVRVNDTNQAVSDLTERVNDLAESVDQTNHNVALLIGAVNTFMGSVSSVVKLIFPGGLVSRMSSQ